MTAHTWRRSRISREEPVAGELAIGLLHPGEMGAFSGALTGNAQRISQERKDGWIRQLRITPLPAAAYVIAKILTSMVTSVPSVVIVLLLGRFYGGVRLAGWKWIAIGLAICAARSRRSDPAQPARPGNALGGHDV